MSFVEKNKAWLLPLLGLGVGAVVYVNLQSLSPKAAPGLPAAPPPRMAPLPAPPGPLPGARAGGDLWSDLVALANPPASLALDGVLRERSRQTLGALLAPSGTPRLPRPGWVREAEAVASAPRVPAVAVAAAAVPAAPAVDFIVSGPEGAVAWIKGRPYRAGDPIAGGPWSVASIQWNRVGLKGPAGKLLTQFMNRSNHPLAGTRPSAEAP